MANIRGLTGFFWGLKMRKFLITWLALAVFGSAAYAENPIPVNTMRLDETGALVPLSLGEEDAVTWLREAVAAAQQRLAVELPSALGANVLEIELVSVPHPDRDAKVNKMFVQWQRELEATSFIPFVSRAVPQKLNVFVSLEARVKVDGQDWIVLPGIVKKQVEYTRGLRLTSAFLEALELSAKPLFDEAINQVVDAAKSRQTGT